MGAGQSDLYKGTYGDNPDNIPDELKGDVKLPDGEAQLKHIFGNNKQSFESTLFLEKEKIWKKKPEERMKKSRKRCSRKMLRERPIL